MSAGSILALVIFPFAMAWLILLSGGLASLSWSSRASVAAATSRLECCALLSATVVIIAVEIGVKSHMYRPPSLGLKL